MAAPRKVLRCCASVRSGSCAGAVGRSRGAADGGRRWPWRELLTTDEREEVKRFRKAVGERRGGTAIWKDSVGWVWVLASPGHEDLTAGEVVSETGRRYNVVEKRGDEAGIVERSDPRSS